jgi:hypothetical protein
MSFAEARLVRFFASYAMLIAAVAALLAAVLKPEQASIVT